MPFIQIPGAKIEIEDDLQPAEKRARIIRQVIDILGDMLDERPINRTPQTDQNKQCALFSAWFAEHALARPAETRTLNADLYESYASYCLKEGVTPASAMGFGLTLNREGYPLRQSNGRRYRIGIELKGRTIQGALAEPTPPLPVPAARFPDKESALLYLRETLKVDPRHTIFEARDPSDFGLKIEGLIQRALIGEQFMVTLYALYADYQSWCLEMDVTAVPRDIFSQMMTQAGFTRGQAPSSETPVFLGIATESSLGEFGGLAEIALKQKLAVNRWIERRAVTGADYSETFAELHADYQAQGGTFNAKVFSDVLTRMGYESRQSGGVRKRYGLALRHKLTK